MYRFVLTIESDTHTPRARDKNLCREKVLRCTRPSFRFDFRVLHFFSSKKKEKRSSARGKKEQRSFVIVCYYWFTTKKLLFDVRAKAKAKAKL